MWRILSSWTWIGICMSLLGKIGAFKPCLRIPKVLSSREDELKFNTVLSGTHNFWLRQRFWSFLVCVSLFFLVCKETVLFRTLQKRRKSKYPIVRFRLKTSAALCFKRRFNLLRCCLIRKPNLFIFASSTLLRSTICNLRFDIPNAKLIQIVYFFGNSNYKL